MLSSSDNGRSALNCHPPTPDTVIGGRTSQKFTGQVRDAESRLDYFGRRYYSAPQGRFLTVDPTMRSAWGEAPQTWNRYSYGLNRPLSTVDPDGGLPFLIALPAAVGAVAGTVSAGTNLWVQHRQGGAINFRDVAAAGAGGFVAGFVGTAAFPALATSSIGAAVGAGTIRQLLPAIVAGGAGNGIGGITERILDSKSNTLLQHAGNIGLDAIVGGAAGIGSFGLKPAFNNMGKDLFAMPIRLRNYPSYSAFSRALKDQDRRASKIAKIARNLAYGGEIAIANHAYPLVRSGFGDNIRFRFLLLSLLFRQADQAAGESVTVTIVFPGIN